MSDAGRPEDFPGMSDPAPYEAPEQAWPKPVGVTSIVIGAVSLTCTACGGAALGLQVAFVAEMAKQFPDGMPPSMGAIEPLMIAQMVGGALVNVVLVVAGAMLVMRKPVARVLHLVYAGLGLIAFATWILLQVQAQVEITEWCKQNPGTKFAQQQQASGPIGLIIGLGLGVVLGLLWPLFCIVWFGAIKRRDADIAGSDQPY
ncbi:MAG: hypothetical protein SFZ24_01205 [Planctomycetota bacterium]|nr:hypothetical protein [Planctomycetota bacterium]